jgi:peptide-methionine (S)-S-oxide reductase
METAIFGGGCFWCTEAIFQSIKGVSSVLPGYTGGSVENPTYEQVCEGNTGHIESTKIEYDPKVVSYKDLLGVFFATHDPTTMDRQGADSGQQYRSAIFYTDASQEQVAKQFIEDLQKDKVYDAPIVTQLRPLDKFYVAEDYHQNYFAKNPGAPYCQMVINPKIKKFRDNFASLLKA